MDTASDVVTYDEWLEDNDDYLAMLYSIIVEKGHSSGRLVFDKCFADFTHAAYKHSTLYSKLSRYAYASSDGDSEEDDKC